MNRNQQPEKGDEHLTDMSASIQTPDTVSLMMTRLLSGPSRPGQAFTMPGTTYGELYLMARRLRACLDDGDDTPVCLGTDDRAVMAAALLASLARGA